MGEIQLVSELSEIAARVQRGRTQGDVLRIAGDGVAALGMRFAAFALEGDELVLRRLATAPARRAALVNLLERAPEGLRAPARACPPIADVLARRAHVFREDHDVFHRFVHAATGRDASVLEAEPATRSVCRGVLAPIFVRDEPWGALSLYSPAFSESDASAVALFAIHVGSALEVASTIAALEHAQKELVERERFAALGELAAFIAHEVRNPLGAITLSLSGLRRHVADEDARKLVDVIDDESQRLNSVVSDLLDFARPTSLRVHPASLGEMVSDVASLVATRPEARAVDVKLDVESDLPEVPMNARLMRHAVLNLVLNGLQAMPAGGTLTLRARKERAFACVDVIDTGTGIDSAAHAHVFEPFFTTKAAGTGLGLPLVKRVVDAHRGTLGFVSSSAGTTFTVGVPLN